MPICHVSLLACLVCGVLSAAPDEPEKPTPKFKPGKDTTYVDGPLDKDGYIDYEAALNERLKGKTTPETNALVLLLKAIGPKPEGTELHADFYKALGIEAPPEKGEYLVGGNYFREGPEKQFPEGHSDLEERLCRRPWKTSDAPKHAEWLKLNEKALSAAVEASKRPDYFLPVVARKRDGGRCTLLDAPMPTVQINRQVAQMLSMRAMRKLEEGKCDQALEDVRAIHRLGRLVARGHSSIESLVGIALQAIAQRAELAIFEHGKPTAEQALAHRDALLKLAPMPAFADKLVFGERFQFLDIVQSWRREGIDVLEMEKPKTPEEIETLAEFLDWETIFRLGNKWYDKMAVAQRKPTRAERIAASAELDKELRSFDAELMDRRAWTRLIRRGAPDDVRRKVSERIGKVYVSLLFPAIQRLSDTADRSEQLHRNGLVAAALAAHFADIKKYPVKLADLVPKYLEKVPDDIFNDKPLIYKKSDTGYLLYSVGVNGKDDGGQLLTDEPRGDDIGVRMPRR